MFSIVISTIDHIICFILVALLIAIECTIELYYLGCIALIKQAIILNDYIESSNLFSDLNFYIGLTIVLNLSAFYLVHKYVIIDNNNNPASVSTPTEQTTMSSHETTQTNEPEIIDLTESTCSESNESCISSIENNISGINKDMITDDEYNQLLFDSAIEIWKNYPNEKWYLKSNEKHIKYIISQNLPVDLKESNELFTKYKGKLLSTIADDIHIDLSIARNNNPHIYKLINGIYKKIKNNYKY